MTEPIKSLEDDALDTAEGLLAALDLACQQRDALEKAASELVRLHDLGKGLTTPDQRDAAWQALVAALALLDAPPGEKS